MIRRFLTIGAALALLAISGPAVAAELSLTAADGTKIHATDYGKGPNGIVLVHDKGRSGSDWTYFAEKLASQDFHVVTLDLRGHGTSKPPETLLDADYLKMTQDVAAAAAWLRSKGATKVSLVGANLGANLALNVAAEDPAITTVVLLSPGLNLSGITLGAAMEKYGKRSILMVASTDDQYATRSVNFLDEKAVGTEKHVEILEGAGSGVKMLNRAPTLEGILISWLNGSFFLKAGAAAPPPNLNVGDTSAVQTTGTKFGEKKPDEPPKPVDLDE